MQILDRLSALFAGSEGASPTTYRCPECEETFTSAKSPDRAVCPDCLAREVEPVD